MVQRTIPVSCRGVELIKREKGIMVCLRQVSNYTIHVSNINKQLILHIINDFFEASLHRGVAVTMAAVSMAKISYFMSCEVTHIQV